MEQEHFSNRFIYYLYEQCVSYGLDMTDRFKNASKKELKKCFNGTGPDGLHTKLRGCLDKLFKDFLPAVLEHDFNFEYENDGGRESFDRHNERFYKNCVRIANIRGTNIFSRWYKRRKAKVAYVAVQEFGWDAYQEAYKKGK